MRCAYHREMPHLENARLRGTTSARCAAMHWLERALTNPYRSEFATVLVVLFWSFTVWLVMRPPAHRLLRVYMFVGSAVAFVVAMALGENMVDLEQRHTAWWLVLQACVIVTGSLLLELALGIRAERRRVATSAAPACSRDMRRRDRIARAVAFSAGRAREPRAADRTNATAS